MAKNFNKPSEDSLQQAVIKYLKLQYPNVIATSESAGRGLNLMQEIIAKRLRTKDGLPDLMIFQSNAQYHGLFLELKKQGVSVLKKNGDFLANEHIKQQHDTLNSLRNQGYFADFCVGFDEAKIIIDYYLADQLIFPKYISNKLKNPSHNE
jgi:hypothetical protein